MTREEFDEALLEAVDFAFHSLGPSIKKSMYYHLKTSFHLTKHSLPEKIEKFDEALRFIFKDGAAILEKLILKELCDRLKVQLNKKVARDFVKTATSLRACYSSDVTVTAVLKQSSRQHKGHVASETKNQRVCHRRWAVKRALTKQRRPDRLSRHGEMFYSESEVAILGIRLIPTQVFNRLGIQINWPCSNREFT